jgi:hypothetical protein
MNTDPTGRIEATTPSSMPGLETVAEPGAVPASGAGAVPGFGFAILLANFWSGATLLTMLLDRHSRLVSTGEGFPFPDQTGVRCSCGEPIERCDFFLAAAAGMRGDNKYDRDLFGFMPGRLRELPRPLRKLAETGHWPGRLRHTLCSLSPAYRRIVADFAAQHREFMQRACQLAGATHFVDATKSLSRADLLMRSGLMPSAIVLLVRDPRAFTHGRLRYVSGDGDKIALAAQEWLHYIRLARRLARAYSAVPYLEVRHEDICTDPARELERIVRLIGFVPEPGQLAGPGGVSHVLGNKMRHSFDGRVFLRERWRETLPPEVQSRVMKLTGVTAVEFGYR